MTELSLYIAFILIVFFSGVFSGSEIAFLRHQRIKSQVWFSNQKKHADKLQFFTDNPEIFLTTILIGNNLLNTAFTAIGTLLFIPFFGENMVVIFLAVIILIFGEILPKVISGHLADSLVLRMMPFIRFAHFMLRPLIFVIAKISLALLKKNAVQQDLAMEEAEVLFTLEDFHSVILESHEQGLVDEHEKEYIANVLDLSSTKVKEIMTPRVDMFGVDIESTSDEMRIQLQKSGYSKIPVYERSMDNITGIIFLYEVIRNKATSIKDLVKPAMYVPDQKKCKDLLIEFRKENRSVAIVIDEYGGTAGIVTMDDLIEVILGQIEFETKMHLHKEIKINDNCYKVSGRTDIDDLIELGFEIPDGDYETIAGFILSYLGRFPKLFEEIIIERLKITVMNVSKKRIQWIQIELLEEQD